MKSFRLHKVLKLTRPHVRSCIQQSSTVAPATTISETDIIKPFSEIPGPKYLYDIPYLGMALHFKPFTKYGMLDLKEVLTSLRDTYGDIFKVRAGLHYTVYISHPDIAETILRAPNKRHRRIVPVITDTFYERNDLGARALSVLNGEEWVKVRKPLQEKLKPQTLENYLSFMDLVTCDLVDKMKTQPEVEDLYQELVNYAAESFGMITLNKRLGCIDKTPPIDFSSTLDNVLKSFHESFLMPMNTFKYFRTKWYRDFEDNFLTVYNLIYKILEEQMIHLQNLANEGSLSEYLEKETNFLYSMLSDDRMTEQKIAHAIMDFYTGGVPATASGITFTLCDLALNPDKQAVLNEEISRVVGNSPHITKQHLEQLSYLKACIKETTRFRYPAFLGILRFLETDVTVGGYKIPEGTTVVITNELMCQDQRFFPRPEAYIPERWVRDEKTDIAKAYQNHPFILKPFGFGARNCPGQRIAEMQMATAIAKIIQNFEVSLPSEIKDIEWHRRVFAFPVHKVNMCLKRRRIGNM